MNQNVNSRNFLGYLLEILQQPPTRAWTSKQQYQNHLVTTLQISSEIFSSLGLCYLAERSIWSLVDLHRTTSQMEKVANNYATLASSFKSIVESGNTNSSFGLGTFYWVQYVGQGDRLNL